RSLPALGEFRINVPFIAHDPARMAHGLLKFLPELIGSVGSVRPLLPEHGQSLATLKCRPGVVGDHRHATQRLVAMRRLEGFDENSLLHSRHAQRLLILTGFYFPSQNRWTLDRRV